MQPRQIARSCQLRPSPGAVHQLGACQLQWARLAGARRLACASNSTTDGSTSTTRSDTDERIKSTMADLDALLGIQEEPAEEAGKVRTPGSSRLRRAAAAVAASAACMHAQHGARPHAQQQLVWCGNTRALQPRLCTCVCTAHLLHARLQAGSTSTSGDAASMELLQSAVTAEVAKLAAGKADGSSASDMERDMTDQMVCTAGWVWQPCSCAGGNLACKGSSRR